MGVYYFYVNETKRQYFCVDPSLQEIKWPFVGRNIGSRAFSYLMLRQADDSPGRVDHVLIGSWIGDHVEILGNQIDFSGNYIHPHFLEIETDYQDIGQQVFEMLVSISPSELYEYGGLDWLIYLLEDPSPIRLTSTILRKLKRHLRKAKQGSRREEMLRIIEAVLKHRSSEQSQPDD